MLEEAPPGTERAARDAALRAALKARLSLDGTGRPDAEALALREVLAGTTPAEAAMLKAVWGRLSAASEGPLVIWGTAAQLLAADRFGLSGQLAAEPEQALDEARKGARAVLDLTPSKPWWGRLLARLDLKIVAALPDDAGVRPRAVMVSREPPGPTGDDRTFWVTDSPQADPEIVARLGEAGLAAHPLLSGGGLKLFVLAGYVQAEDGRLIDAPGDLTGVIGAAPVF